jgi:hypothetical protein
MQPARGVIFWKSVYCLRNLAPPAGFEPSPAFRRHNRLIRRNGIPPIIVAGVTCPVFGRMLGHSLAILMTTYAHLTRSARYASNIPGTQDKVVRVMDEILTPIPIVLRDFG